MRSVLLVHAPMGALDRPALGLGLLATEAARRGRRCDTRYLTFLFADLVGVDDYHWLVGGPPYEALVGEWLFAEALFGQRADVDAGYAELLVHRFGLDGDDLTRLERARRCATHFVETCRTLVPWSGYDVVGFTSTFQQNVASLALARVVKHDHPDVSIVFGGANWEGDMGAALLDRFPFVDAACQGEADDSFPALLEHLDRTDRSEPVGAVPGVIHRLAGAPIAGPPALVHDLDRLPIPDFTPFFTALAESPSGLGVPPRLLVETARGCWWGARSHCTFCGLNGSSMAFRSKSPERVLHELRTLYERHAVPIVSVVDNIFDMRYSRTVLPELARDGPQLDLFWEVKANLSQQQVRQLAEAGVRHVQPGIESMSDHVLDLMRKGTTMMRNVQLLKWGAEHGVRIDWNLLFGVPGETAADYAGMARLFDLIPHLDPPGAVGPVRLDRFSPYHADPAAHGMTAVRAMAPYRFIYDVPADELDRIAYYFDFEFADRRDPLTYVTPALHAVERWRAVHGGGGLWAIEREGGELAVVDERPGRRRRSSVLTGWKAVAFRAIDRARSHDELLAMPELDGVDADELDGFLRRAVDVGVVLADGRRWLGLAVFTPARTEQLATRRTIELAVSGADA